MSKELVSEKWINMNEWYKCRGEVDEQSLEGTLCYAGLDLNSKEGISAFVMIFPQSGGGFKVLARFWLPEDNALEIERDTTRPIRYWVDNTIIELTPGNVIDYQTVEDRIVEDSKRFRIQAIGFDPWGAVDLVLRLQDNHGLKMVEVKQTFQSLTAPSRELNILIGKGLIAHGRNSVLDLGASLLWMKLDAKGRCRPLDPRLSAGQYGVGGMLGLIMALGLAKDGPC